MADPIPSTSMHKPSFFALVLALLVAAPVSVFCQESITVTANGVSFKMIRVQGGTFSMGATSEQGSDAFDDEKPVHQVSLSSYYLCETEVTQELWVAVMGSNPSMFKPKEVSAARGSYDDFVANANRLNAKRAGTVRIPSRQEWDAAMVTRSGSMKRPVEQVSWVDCQEFVRRLNQLTGRTFRLPTEAEWEFAARGGTRSRGYKYSGGNDIGEVAWYQKNAYKGESHPDYGTHDVKTKRANELGFYDMSGNVCEWCQDWSSDYSSSSQTNPKGPGSGSGRVFRGGSWTDDAGSCRVSDRNGSSPSARYRDVGFRLAL